MNEHAHTSSGQDPKDQMMQETREMDTANKPAPLEESREHDTFPDESAPEELQEDLDSAPPGEPTD